MLKGKRQVVMEVDSFEVGDVIDFTLTDGEEVITYETNPLSYDTDEDSILDGDEIVLGLDPLSPVTNSVPDGDRIFERVIQNIDSDLLIENTAIPHITITSTGNPVKQIFTSASENTQLADNPAIVGKGTRILLSSRVEGSSITFETEDDRLLHELMVCLYDEDTGDIRFLDTTLDNNDYFTAALDGSGVYFLIDIAALMEYLEIDLDAIIEDIQSQLPVAGPAMRSAGLPDVPEAANPGGLAAEILALAPGEELSPEVLERYMTEYENSEASKATLIPVEELEGFQMPEAHGAPVAFAYAAAPDESKTLDVMFLVDTSYSFETSSGSSQFLRIFLLCLNELFTADPAVDFRFGVAFFGGMPDSYCSVYAPDGTLGSVWQTEPRNMDEVLMYYIRNISYLSHGNHNAQPARSAEWVMGLFDSTADQKHVALITDKDISADSWSHPNGAVQDYRDMTDSYALNGIKLSAFVPETLFGVYNEIERTGGEVFHLTEDDAALAGFPIDAYISGISPGEFLGLL